MDHSTQATVNGTDCKVSMLWNWYTIDACFLSETWQIKNAGMFAASCIGVGLLTICLEVLRRLGKEYDLLLVRQFQARAAELQARGPKVNCCDGDLAMGPQSLLFRATPLQQLIRAVIHAVTFGLAYIIMLLAMYYNGYLIISIIVGAGIGKFLCDWMTYRVSLSTAMTIPAALGVEEPSVCCG